MSAKDTLKRAIRNQFDKIDFKNDWIYGKAEELINTAKSYGFNDLAEEMQNDL